MRSSLSDSTVTLVSGEIKFIQIFAGDRPRSGDPLIPGEYLALNVILHLLSTDYR